MSNLPEWLVPGMVMHEDETGTKVGVIKTVYKTGNFTLEGSRDQWRSGNCAAWRASSHGYNRTRIIPYWGKSIEKLERLKLLWTVVSLSHYFQRALPMNNLRTLSLEQMEDVHALLERARDGVKEVLRGQSHD